MILSILHSGRSSFPFDDCCFLLDTLYSFGELWHCCTYACFYDIYDDEGEGEVVHMHSQDGHLKREKTFQIYISRARCISRYLSLLSVLLASMRCCAIVVVEEGRRCPSSMNDG